MTCSATASISNSTALPTACIMSTTADSSTKSSYMNSKRKSSLDVESIDQPTTYDYMDISSSSFDPRSSFNSSKHQLQSGDDNARSKRSKCSPLAPWEDPATAHRYPKVNPLHRYNNLSQDDIREAPAAQRDCTSVLPQKQRPPTIEEQQAWTKGALNSTKEVLGPKEAECSSSMDDSYMQNEYIGIQTSSGHAFVRATDVEGFLSSGDAQMVLDQDISSSNDSGEKETSKARMCSVQYSHESPSTSHEPPLWMHVEGDVEMNSAPSLRHSSQFPDTSAKSRPMTLTRSSRSTNCNYTPKDMCHPTSALDTCGSMLRFSVPSPSGHAHHPHSYGASRNVTGGRNELGAAYFDRMSMC